MITEDELKALLKNIETDNIELTTSISDTDKFCQAICAFANDMPNRRGPGYLLIGVQPDGMLSDLTVTDEILRNVADIRSAGNILPQPYMTVARFSLDGGDVLVVEVNPSDLPPVRYKGRIFIRVGPRRAIASEQEERVLTERRIAFARSFDARSCYEATLDDMARGQFDAYRQQAIDPETISANSRNIEQQMASLRFYDSEHRCPTYAGIVLFGKNPRFYMPGNYIQYLKLPGRKLSDFPEDQSEISGDLLTVLRDLEGRLRLIIQTKMRAVSPLGEKLLPDYPEFALRELLMNAVMHRNYDSNSQIRFHVFSDV